MTDDDLLVFGYPAVHLQHVATHLARSFECLNRVLRRMPGTTPVRQEVMGILSVLSWHLKLSPRWMQEVWELKQEPAQPNVLNQSDNRSPLA